MGTGNENMAQPVQQQPVQQQPEQQYSNDEQQPPHKKKRKRHFLRSLLRLIIVLVIIAAGIYGILYLVAIAAKYDSIGAMLRNMSVELSLIWQRIRN